MNIGFVGLGKLGLPYALVIEGAGHKVLAVDPSAAVATILQSKKNNFDEPGVDSALERSAIRLTNFGELVREAEVIFVTVQTPHDIQFEGISPMPEERNDFDYSFLVSAIESLAKEIHFCKKSCIIVVSSTVLPGTVKKYIEPIIEKRRVGELIELVYSPSFIAMGSAINDFKHPEFQLIGTNSGADISKLTSLYSTIHDRPQFVTTVQNAELIKVLYNTFIGMKIVFANTCMEACHKIPNTDVDQISKALSLATERVMSARYLQGGMGDGGGCHPRDNIAMSWLARELDLSYDIFSDVIRARELQTRWLVSLIKQELASSHLPVVLLGDSYKGDCSLKTGSPARLLSYYLSEQGIEHQVYDPYNEESTFQKNTAALYFISTRHTAWINFNFPPNSVILDPFRYLAVNESIQSCKYIGIGAAS